MIDMFDIVTGESLDEVLLLLGETIWSVKHNVYLEKYFIHLQFNKFLKSTKLTAFTDDNLIFSSTGRMPASYCHGVESVVHSSVSPSIHSCVRL